MNTGIHIKLLPCLIIQDLHYFSLSLVYFVYSCSNFVRGSDSGKKIPFKSTFCPLESKWATTPNSFWLHCQGMLQGQRSDEQHPTGWTVGSRVGECLPWIFHFWEQAPDMVLVIPSPSPAPCWACLHQTRKTAHFILHVFTCSRMKQISFPGY